MSYQEPLPGVDGGYAATERAGVELAEHVAGIANPRERLAARRDLVQRAMRGETVACIAAGILMLGQRP